MTLPHSDAPLHGTLERSWRPNLAHYYDLSDRTLSLKSQSPLTLHVGSALCYSRTVYASKLVPNRRDIHTIIESDRAFFGLIDERFKLLR